MLLQILWSLEGLAAEVALVWLERDMYANVRCYVVTLHCGCPTCAPLACEVEIVGALATDMALAYMILECVSIAAYRATSRAFATV